MSQHSDTPHLNINKAGLARAHQLFQEQSVLRSRDFDAVGIGREYLRLLMERGEIMRLSRGVYAAVDAPLTNHYALALCALRAPKGVVCLLSALLFHEIGTALPWQVWLAVGVKAHKPRLDYPPLQIVRFSTTALTEGVDILTQLRVQSDAINCLYTLQNLYIFEGIGLLGNPLFRFCSMIEFNCSTA